MSDLAKNFNLIRIGDRWHYRRRIPQDLLTALEGKEVIKFSLKTNDIKVARQLRDVEELRWNEKFHKLRNPQSTESQSTISFLSTAETQQMIRDQVTEEINKFAKVVEGSPTLTANERSEIASDQRFELNSLKSGDSYADEWLSGAWSRLESKASNGAHQMLANEQHISLLLRGLIEVANIKLRQVNHDFSKVFIDPAFNPSAKGDFNFDQLTEDYLLDYKEKAKLNGRTAKTIDKVEQNVGLIRELVGPNTSLNLIDFDFVENLKIKLAKVPTNYKKIFTGKSLDEAIEEAALASAPRLAHKSQRQYLGALGNLLKRAKSKKWLVELPASDLKPVMEDKIKAKDKREAFTIDQLNKFFSSPFYQAAANDDPKVKAKSGFSWRYWLPLVALFSGMRGNEICQLLASDIKQTKAGTWYFDVNDQSSAHSNQGSNLPKYLKSIPALVRFRFITLSFSLGF